jgi:ABC-type polysaccharide/polyol phosphate export permease
MVKLRNLKDNASQIIALTEKNVKLQLRYKLGLIASFITTIISILMPLIIMGNLFETRTEIGPWTQTNFIVYQFIAYNIILLKDIITIFPNQFRNEKYWKTLTALIIGPFNRVNLLLGVFLSRLITISIPFTVFFVLGIIFQPISIFSVFIILGIFFLIALIFSGIGLTLGIFAISNENIWKILQLLLFFVFWFSCVTYPFEIFPDFIQKIISLNPLYYLFDILRICWIQNNIFITIGLYPFHFIILILSSIILPYVGVILFNRIYKKYGITGY